MSVILEFTLPADSVPFGRSTSGDPSVRVRLERLVSLRESRVPFLWATGEDFEQFERHLRDSDVVEHVGQFGLTSKQYEALTTAYERGYYRVPRETGLEELAEELDISHQALSERLRRATMVLVGEGLLVGPSSSDTSP